MEFSPFFPFAAPQSLKAAVGHLASLDKEELTTLNEVFAHLDAPINRRGMRATGESVRQKISRLSDGEWESVVALALQLTSVSDFMDMLESLRVLDDETRPKIKNAVDTFKANQALKKVIAIDNVLERGPRLQHFSCFCDVRTHFSDSAENAAGTTYVPREEFRVPIAIVRIRVDEVQGYVYFQLSASELDEHIAKLQKARDQLRHVIETERK
jgi:hypothetical protein